MLIQFSFNNYKSFRDDTILDLSATKISEHNERVVKIGNEKLLTSAAIYGANASGKSNLIEAFRFMSAYVADSFAFGDDKSINGVTSERLHRIPFLFDMNSKEEPSNFEVFFISSESGKSNKIYNYGFALNKNGVEEEWLNYKSMSSKEFKTFLYRGDGKLEFDGIPTRSQENIRIALGDYSLVASLGAKLNISIFKMVREWFLKVRFKNFGDPYENAFLSRMAPMDFDKDKTVQDNVVKFFSSFDPSIVGFEVKTFTNDKNEESMNINAVHHIAGTDKTTSIPLEQESDGTLKMFALYPVLRDVLEDGGILCIDELNARLHPLLVRSFIITFLNPETNPNHAQLIFTTHDAWQLSNNLLRRDEIWFTEKQKDGNTILYSLADFVDEDGVKIRKDESFEKNYLLGKYGAIPDLSAFDMFKGD